MWRGRDSDGPDDEIFLYDGNTTTQITHNDYDDGFPVIWGSNVVWSGYDGNDNEIFFYDGDSITQITDNEYYDSYPQIWGSNVVWLGNDGDGGLDVFLATPEPATLGLLLLGGLAVLRRRRQEQN